MRDDFLTRPTRQERIQAAFREHSRLLQSDPARAHWNAAAVATTVGLGFSMARGSVAALLSPPGQRLAAFYYVSRGVSPLYVIPFVLATQVDCYAATWANRGAPRPPSEAGLGGAADLG